MLMLLHFGVFHNSTLLLTLPPPAALGQPLRAAFWEHGRTLRWPDTQLDLGQHDQTCFVKHQQEKRKSS